ncbi:MAG: hypothetical protein KatS3mg104_0487 [Phycisphaerae bacterium]|jgi:hypothetical protein|nr:MAG: hypothetical protein KatS3mg104_0487 [Phycisphaerae bacterium]
MNDAIELAPSSTPIPPQKDCRPFMPEPPVVRVEAIEDVTLDYVAGLETLMNAFYRDGLAFERIDDPGLDGLTYKAENVLVRFRVVERPSEKPDLRPLMVQIPHFYDFVRMLTEQETEHEFQRGMTPGLDRVLLRDPSGNWVSVGLRADVR